MTILGSGGFRAVPRPGCACVVCEEAREKGFQRLGPSLFIHDENILFDTPENIIVELQKAGIGRVDHIFYTHWHPDHTFGARLVEQMNTTWSEDLSCGWATTNPYQRALAAAGVVLSLDELKFFEASDYFAIHRTFIDNEGKLSSHQARCIKEDLEKQRSTLWQTGEQTRED